MLKNSIPKISAALLCAAVLFSLAACQSSPATSLVKNKDLDRMIEEAKNTDAAREDIAGLLDQNYDAYTTTIKNDDLGVTVNVNAKVDIPKTDRLSVFRVRQKQFSQDFIDIVRRALLGEKKLYDGGVLSVKTKQDIEAEIALYRTEMAGLDANDGYRAECQSNIDALQTAYQSAPGKLDFSPYPSDGQLCTAEKMLTKHPENEYYQWMKEVNAKGSFLYEISDGTDGNYAVFFVQNNPEKSNKLVFRTNGVFYENHGGVMVGQTSLTPNTESEEYPQNFLFDGVFSDLPSFSRCPGAVEGTTLDSAVKTADAFLAKIGLDGFAYYEGGLFNEYLLPQKESDDGDYYAGYYILRYYRKIDGVFLTQSSGDKNNPGDEYGEGKLSWPGECIEFRVNDDGIVGFDWNAPLEIVQTVVENAALKPFADVKSIFERMMPITKASQSYTKAFTVDRVRLSYSRISEADSYDTGLIVPVWDFSGQYEYSEDQRVMEKGDGGLLAVNAVDGSIIDPNLGY